jgi:hypothetical protein
MKRWLVATLVILVTFLMPVSDALSRGRHHGGGHRGSRYSYRFGFNFLIPLNSLFYRPYYSYPPYYYEPYPPAPYYPRRYYPVSLNWQDRDILSSKTQYALENVRSGMKVKWLNPGTAVGGYVIPRPAFKNSQGQWCREYERLVALGGWTKRSEGTACRQPDGIWR